MLTGTVLTLVSAVQKSSAITNNKYVEGNKKSKATEVDTLPASTQANFHTNQGEDLSSTRNALSITVINLYHTYMLNLTSYYGTT